MSKAGSNESMYEGRNASVRTSSKRGNGGDGKSSLRLERLPKLDKGVCPMMSAYLGTRAHCLGVPCRMWVDSQHLKYLMKDIKGDCGYKLLSLYAGFELDRIMRYDKTMGDMV